MGWDNSRPVPWQRLVREWLIYAAVMSAIFIIFFRGDNVIGAIAGVFISGPLYLGFGAVMAKFGYNRTRLKDIRSAGKSESAAATDRKGRNARGSETAEDPGPLRKPAPTSRTAGGANRPKSANRRRR